MWRAIDGDRRGGNEFREWSAKFSISRVFVSHEWNMKCIRWRMSLYVHRGNVRPESHLSSRLLHRMQMKGWLVTARGAKMQREEQRKLKTHCWRAARCVKKKAKNQFSRARMRIARRLWNSCELLKQKCRGHAIQRIAISKRTKANYSPRISPRLCER